MKSSILTLLRRLFRRRAQRIDNSVIHGNVTQIQNHNGNLTINTNPKDTP